MKPPAGESSTTPFARPIPVGQAVGMELAGQQGDSPALPLKPLIADRRTRLHLLRDRGKKLPEDFVLELRAKARAVRPVHSKN